MKSLKKIKDLVDTQIEFGPSEHAMYRLQRLVEELEKELPPQSEPQRFTPGTPQFDLYVFQKVNCKRDVKNIAARYGIDEDKVLEAYDRGQDQTKV